MNDPELLTGLANSTLEQREAAFRELVKRYLPLVYGAARRQLPDAHLAEDAAQVVFLVLARKAAALPRDSVLPAWLLNVTHYVCKDMRKRVARRMKHERRAAAMIMPEATPAVEQDFSQVTPHLDAALAALPAADRAVVVLRYLQSQPLAEVAASLHVSEEAARKRLQRALERIRSYFARHNITVSAAALPLALSSHATFSTTPAALPATILSDFAHNTAGPALHPVLGAALRNLFWTPAKLALIAAAIALCVIPLAAIPLLRRAPALSAAPAAAPLSAAPNVRAPTVPATPQQTRAREILYQLRYSLVFVKTPETYAQIRELSQLGPAVVPEICAELERTSNDSERRYLALTLRIINDRRAIPALIHALGQTRPHSSDCGDTVRDSDLWQFVNDHRLPEAAPEEYPNIDIPRSDSQILATLKALTGISLSTDNYFRNETRRDLQSDRWQQWWDAHVHDFLTSEQLASLQTPPGDPVEAAGTARFGKLFPAGPNVHLSPVHDLILAPQGFWDRPAYLNFATGRAFTLLENVSDPAANTTNYSQWFREMHIDAMCSTYISNAVQVGNTNMLTAKNPKYSYGLNASNLRVWNIDSDRWNTLETEIHSAASLSLQGSMLDNDFYLRDPDTHDVLRMQYPSTFLFITADNTRGVVQLLGESTNPRGLHLRYRLFETGVPLLPMFPNKPKEPTRQFSPEVTVTFAAPRSASPSAIDFRTGATRAADSSIFSADPAHPASFGANLGPWLASWHGDAIVQQPDAGQNPFCLHCHAMATFVCTPSAWETFAPSDVLSLLTRRATKEEDFIMREQEGLSPLTYAFQTADGAQGLIQITAATPASLTIHYKLLAR